jgi:glycine/D-amino acid oxidase-like deaminating enzyme
LSIAPAAELVPALVAAWGASLWIAQNPPPPAGPAFPGTLDTDIAIIGAGAAGTSLAFHLAAGGGEAVVLEAARQPFAATAASAGVIAPQLVRNTPTSVMERLGVEAGGRFLRLLAGAGRNLFDLARTERIVCDAQGHGFLNPVTGEDGPERLRALISQWALFRRDLELADAARTRALTGAEGYSACLIDPTGGGIDPVAFVQGLSERTPAAKVATFRDSPVISVTRRGSGWAVRTAEGVLTARRVVLCAGGANGRLHRALQKTLLPLAVYQVATAPLPSGMRRGILPGGHALTDTSSDVFSIRLDGAGRLITALPAVRDMSRDELDRVINDRLVAALPAYERTPLEFGWKGVAWLNPTLLPRLTQVDDGLIAVQACNGRGLALNTALGADLAAWLLAPDAGPPALPLEPPRPIAGYAFARHMPGLMMAAAGLARGAVRLVAPQTSRRTS